MEITVAQAQSRVPVTVLQPHGELDASNYHELIAKARTLICEQFGGTMPHFWQ